MTETDTINQVRLPVLRMAGIGVLVCVFTAALGGLIGETQSRGFGAGLWTLGATVPGVLATLLMLNTLPPRAPALWAAPVLGGTMLRALVALGLGLAVYLGAGPDKYVFFLTLASALVGVLALDVLVSVKLINSDGSPRAPRGVMEGA